MTGVISLICGAIGAFFSSYLAQRGQNKANNENYNEIKSQLSSSTKIIEGIRADFEKQNHEYKLKLESYHIKSIESIEKLFELLVDIENNTTIYILNSNFGQGLNEQYKLAKKSIDDFILYSRTRLFWIPEDLYIEIEKLAMLLDQHVHSVLLQIGSQNPQTLSALQKGTEANDRAIDALQHEVPKAKAAIINSIRSYVGPQH